MAETERTTQNNNFTLHLKFISEFLPDLPSANISPGKDGIWGIFPLPRPDIMFLQKKAFIENED